MPGYLKVNGAQQPIVSPYVKVAGTWTPSALGYIKVDGEWKIWHSAKIEDDFNRAGAGDLGTASNGFSKWTALSGSWGISSNQASHNSTTVGISSTRLYKATTDYKVSIDIPANTGLGVAFWILDADNWHAAIPGVRQQDNPGFYSCPSGFTLEGTNCRKTTVYDASYEGPYTTGANSNPTPIYGACDLGVPSGDRCVLNQPYTATCTTTTTYSCPSGCTRSGTTCTCKYNKVTTQSFQNLGCLDNGLCSRSGGTCGGACTGGCRCSKVVNGCGCEDPRTGLVSSISCNSSCTQTYTTSATPTSTKSCTCDGGVDNGSSTSCIRQVDLGPRPIIGYNQNYYCSGNCSLSGSSCNCPGQGLYCPSGGTRNGNVCTLTQNQSATYTPPFTTYPSVIRIYKSVGGTVTQDFSQDISSDPRSFEVSTLGNNIQVYAYSAAALGGTRIAAISHASVNPVKTTTVGLAKYGNQVQRQGTAIDNFKAE